MRKLSMFGSVAVVIALGLSPGAAQALSFSDVRVEAEVGGGANEAMIVFDWETGVTPSHAWLFRWDGVASVANAFDAIQAAEPGFEWPGGNFVSFIRYDGDDGDQHDSLVTFQLAFWNSLDGESWEVNDVGVAQQLLVDGGWSGANANLPAGVFPGDPPNVPIIPEPSTALLLGLGIALLGRRARRPV